MQNPRDFERERDVPGEQGERGPEFRGTRYGSTGMGPLALTDLVRWGPIVAGFAATVAILILLGVLGAAIGLTAGAAVDPTLSAIWAVISLIVAFFVGGWVCVRTLGIAGTTPTVLNSSIVWAFTLMFTVFLAALGAAGLLGAMTNLFGAPAPGADPGAAMAGATAWWALAGLILGWIACVVGGLVAQRSEAEVMGR